MFTRDSVQRPLTGINRSYLNQTQMLFISPAAAALGSLIRTESVGIQNVARTSSAAPIVAEVSGSRGFFGNLWNAPSNLAATPGAIQGVANKASGTLEHVKVKTLPGVDNTLHNFDKLAVDASKLATNTGKTVEQLGKNSDMVAKDISKLQKTADTGIKVIAGSAAIAALAGTGAAISTVVSNHKDSKKISELEKSLLQKDNQLPNGPHIVDPNNNSKKPQVAPSVGVQSFD